MTNFAKKMKAAIKAIEKEYVSEFKAENPLPEGYKWGRAEWDGSSDGDVDEYSVRVYIKNSVEIIGDVMDYVQMDRISLSGEYYDEAGDYQEWGIEVKREKMMETLTAGLAGKIRTHFDEEGT